jgi:putative tricarboxylic transport membrane protein
MPADLMTESRTRIVVAELLLGLGVAGLGLFIAIETSKIQVAPVYARVGPTVIPLLVAGMLMLLGAILVVQAARGRRAAAGAAAAPSDWQALVAISVGLWLQILLLEPAGFVIASALLFLCVAWGFGSRRVPRDLAIGLALAVATYIGFTKGLDLALPAGVLAGVL